MVIMSADLERNYLVGFWTVDIASSEEEDVTSGWTMKFGVHGL
jgi:hypothetical protein